MDRNQVRRTGGTCGACSCSRSNLPEHFDRQLQPIHPPRATRTPTHRMKGITTQVREQNILVGVQASQCCKGEITRRLSERWTYESTGHPTHAPRLKRAVGRSTARTSLRERAPGEVQLNVSVRTAGDVNDRPTQSLVQRTHGGSPSPDALPCSQSPASPVRYGFV